MKNMLSCLKRIEYEYVNLKGAEKKAAEYILKNPQNVIHFSITELADNCGVSETTIFRLCNKLGYKGYQDLKINLAAEIIEPVQNIYEEIKENDDMQTIMQKFLISNIQSLETTIKLNNSRTIEMAVDIICNAKRLLFFGMGGSSCIAFDAYHKFIRTGIECVVQGDSHMQITYAALSNNEDAVIAISNTGSNKELFEAVNLAKSNGAKIITITGHAKSPIAKLSDIVLISYGKESKFRSEAMESRLSSLMLIDLLYIGVALKKKNELLDNLEKIRKAIAMKRF